MNLIAVCMLSIASLGANERGYLLKFSSPQCPPCQQVAPIVAKLEREGHPIRSIDVTKDQAAAEQYRITTIPAFVLIVDGREVDRETGYQTESQIRQMLARIPTGSATRSPNGGPLPIQLGESAPIPRPQKPLGQASPRSQAGGAVAENGSDRGWPFPKPKSQPSVFRGKDPEPMPEADVGVLPASPMDASARLRIITGGSEVKGSGTVIESRPGRTVLLTCSHVLRDANDSSRVEVDLFRNGKPTTYLGSIIGSDSDADVGLIAIRTTDESFPVVPVAGLDGTPAAGNPVYSIGCGGGEPPSREQLRVTDINLYKGPDTLVCTGVPVMGRSGGGLFDTQGSLVGVCFAADETGKRGVYCGLRPIHDLLTKHELAHLVPRSLPSKDIAKAAPETQRPMDEEPNSPESKFFNTRNQDGQSEFANTPPPKVPPASSPPASAEAYAADDAEVVVVIRSRTAGPAGDKVILIHKPSRQFLNFVQGELGDSSASVPISKQDQVAPESRITRQVKPRVSDSQLLPTGLPSKIGQRPLQR